MSFNKKKSYDLLKSNKKGMDHIQKNQIQIANTVRADHLKV